MVYNSKYHFITPVQREQLLDCWELGLDCAGAGRVTGLSPQQVDSAWRRYLHHELIHPRPKDPGPSKLTDEEFTARYCSGEAANSLAQANGWTKTQVYDRASTLGIRRHVVAVTRPRLFPEEYTPPYSQTLRLEKAAKVVYQLLDSLGGYEDAEESIKQVSAFRCVVLPPTFVSGGSSIA